jgi:hypothetical protein
MTFEEAKLKYGEIDGLKWKDEAKHCKSIIIPEPFCWNVINTLSRRSWTRCYLNKDMEAPLLLALKYIVDEKLWPEFKTFDGCFNVRDIRGKAGKLSDHAYAMAIDINASTNALGTDGDISLGIVNCFKKAGFYWGGHYKRKDPMHFSLIKG